MARKSSLTYSLSQSRFIECPNKSFFSSSACTHIWLESDRPKGLKWTWKTKAHSKGKDIILLSQKKPAPSHSSLFPHFIPFVQQNWWVFVPHAGCCWKIPLITISFSQLSVTRIYIRWLGKWKKAFGRKTSNEFVRISGRHVPEGYRCWVWVREWVWTKVNEKID